MQLWKLSFSLHKPSIVAYITPTTCLRISVWHALKACHQLYTLRSAVRSQNGGTRPWEVYAVHLLVLYSSTPIIPLLLCSPCKVHWIMGNTVYLWQIWVALLAVLQDISLYVSLTQMHLEQCFPQNEILSVSVADWRQQVYQVLHHKYLNCQVLWQ